MTGKAGEVFRVPSGGAVTSPTLVLVGLGDLGRGSEKLTAEQVRRAAGVAARNVGNAASVALALPAADAAQVRAVADGFLTGSYVFHGSKAGRRRSRSPRSRSSPRRPAARTASRRSRRPGCSPVPATRPATG